MSDSIVFGIDLGTTYSCISYIDEFGKPVVAKNTESQSITPSVVFFDGSQIIVGDTAKENSKLYPDQVVSFIKRNMGDPNFIFIHENKEYRPEEISSFILKKLVGDAETALGKPVKEVVITCPAYFGVNEREATRLAGEIAGLNVRAILNEPTAAAIAYGLAESQSRSILIYDLGGGTFDVTLIRVDEKAIEVVCTGGDHHLGGKDWDDCIIQFLISEFQTQTDSFENLLDDPEAYNDLALQAEKIKKTLSTRERAPFVMSHAGQRAKGELSREKFDELTQPLLERTISLMNEMFAEAAKKGVRDFDEVLLVGGSTRMPQVSNRIKNELGKEPKIFDPDESVAKGAAFYGWKLTLNDELISRIAAKTGKSEEQVRQEPIPERVMEQAAQDLADQHGFTLAAVKSSTKAIFNVCSKSFGIVALDGSQNNKEMVFNLILKNTRVPNSVGKPFGTTEDNQENVLLRVMENELSEVILELTQAKEIGVATLDMPSGLPAGSLIDISFTLNEEGRLEMTAVERKESRKVNIVIETKSVISGEELSEAKARSSKISVS